MSKTKETEVTWPAAEQTQGSQSSIPISQALLGRGLASVAPGMAWRSIDFTGGCPWSNGMKDLLPGKAILHRQRPPGKRK